MRITGLATAAVVFIALGLAGCGSSAPMPAGPKVTLTVSTPTDGSRVSSASTTVSGRVHPARAQVQVLGHPVDVGADGSFSIQVPLTPGANLFDIEASAPRSAGAAAAVRVVRFLLVTVPDVSGDSPMDATTALQALGLHVSIDASSVPLSFLIPGATQICSISPPPGARVIPGARITLHTSKLCGL